jgi:hypothetical protein
MHSFATHSFFQLKYCERCGGLWLRPDSAVTPYCPTCDRFMADLPSRTQPARCKNMRGGRAPVGACLEAECAL